MTICMELSGDQRTTCGFSPSTIWMPGIKFRSSGLVESILYPLRHLSDPIFLFYNYEAISLSGETPKDGSKDFEGLRHA